MHFTKRPFTHYLYALLPFLAICVALIGAFYWNGRTQKTEQKAHAVSLYYLIKNTGNGLCLQADQTHVILNHCDKNNDSQKFRGLANAYAKAGKIYSSSIISLSTNKCLDHANQKEVNGFQPILNNCYENAEQQSWWKGTLISVAKPDNGSGYTLYGDSNGQVGSRPYLSPRSLGQNGNSNNLYQQWETVLLD